MSKPLMPQVHDGYSGDSGYSGDESLWGRQCQRVELAMAVTSEEHRMGCKILDRKTERVKFNTNIVVPSKTTN
jgi:hypothetical protein